MVSDIWAPPVTGAAKLPVATAIQVLVLLLTAHQVALRVTVRVAAQVGTEAQVDMALPATPVDMARPVTPVDTV